MGSGASSPRSATAGIEAATKVITEKELEAHFEGLSAECRAKLFTSLNKSMAAKGTYTVYYHNKCEKFYGRAFPLLCVLEAGGAKYEVKEVADAPPGCGFVAAPACLTPSGACIAQTGACTMMLSEELGLAPALEPHRSDFKKLILDGVDFLGEVFAKGKSEKPEDAERLKKWLTYFEQVLTKSESGFLCGPGATGADYGLNFAMTAAKNFAQMDLSSYEKVTKWLEIMAKQPAVVKLVEKGVPIIPP